MTGRKNFGHGFCFLSNFCACPLYFHGEFSLGMGLIVVPCPFSRKPTSLICWFNAKFGYLLLCMYVYESLKSSMFLFHSKCVTQLLVILLVAIHVEKYVIRYLKAMYLSTRYYKIFNHEGEGCLRSFFFFGTACDFLSLHKFRYLQTLKLYLVPPNCSRHRI